MYKPLFTILSVYHSTVSGGKAKRYNMRSQNQGLLRALHIFDFIKGLPGFLQLLVHSQELAHSCVHPRLLSHKEDDIFHLSMNRG